MRDPIRGNRVFKLAVAVEVGAGVLAIIVGAAVGSSPWSTLHWDASMAAAAAVAVAPMLCALALFLRLPIAPLRRIRAELEVRVLPLLRDCSLGQIALICAAAGLGEELLFRGLIQRHSAELWGPLPGLAVASIVFGLAHPITVAYTLVAGLLGGYLGWLWFVSGNLLVPVLAHAIYDYVALVVLLRNND